MGGSLGQDANIFDDAFAHDPSILIKVVRYPGRPKGAGSQASADTRTRVC